MDANVEVVGIGHAVGSQTISNTVVAKSLDLPPDWFEQRTGISERRVCAPGEDVLTLADRAIRLACLDASLDVSTLGAETVLLHIQNGFTDQFTPPAGIILCQSLGLNKLRAMAIDGVCAEPVAALELGTLLLLAKRCDRVIISAAADFVAAINPQDRGTAGLFGAGAGALILCRSTNQVSQISSLSWQTHSEHFQLGRIPILARAKTALGTDISIGFYEMDGQGLARAALKILPAVVEDVLSESGWQRDDIDVVIAHQPNARMLAMGVHALGLDPAKVAMPVTRLGNMGPASVLVTLSIAKEEGRLAPGSWVLLLAFGLGFSVGAATVTM